MPILEIADYDYHVSFKYEKVKCSKDDIHYYINLKDERIGIVFYYNKAWNIDFLFGNKERIYGFATRDFATRYLLRIYKFGDV